MTEPKKPINFFNILPSFQWPGNALGLPAAAVRNPQVSCSNTKPPMLTMDRADERNRAQEPSFLSRALPAILGKRRLGE
jgi:hypothetical protein